MNISNKRKRAYQNQNTEFLEGSIYIDARGIQYRYYNNKLEELSNSNNQIILNKPKPREYTRMYSAYLERH